MFVTVIRGLATPLTGRWRRDFDDLNRRDLTAALVVARAAVRFGDVPTA